MKRLIIFSFILFAVVIMAFSSGKIVFFEKPEGWPKPVYDFKRNPLSAEKIALGRKLFYDPILSRNNTISCSSCHLQYTAFTHVDHSLSHGIDGKIGTRNSSSLANLAWSKSFMWDGAVNHLDMQALAPISNPLEMDETIKHVCEKLQAEQEYISLFKNAFGDSIITGEFVLKSLSQFVLTMVSANSKYDKMKRGELDFSEHERNGYKLFQKNCGSCHSEPLFTNEKFENNGLMVDTTLNDIGRMAITHNPKDSLCFKVPTLRNIEFTFPYMHDGRFKNLKQVINNYMMGIQESKTLSPQLKKGIYFSPIEKADLMTFLLTLSDKEFAYNPKFSFPAK